MKNFSIALSVTACVAALLFSGCRTTLPPNRPTQAEFYTAAEDLVRQAESGALQSFINSYYEKNKGDKERGFYPLVMWAPTQFNLTTLHGAHRIHIEPLMIRFQEIAINKGICGVREISGIKNNACLPRFKYSRIKLIYISLLPLPVSPKSKLIGFFLINLAASSCRGLKFGALIKLHFDLP